MFHSWVKYNFKSTFAWEKANIWSIIYTMLSTYFAMNAWREILARIFEDLPNQDNVSPDWLINPATKRRLKLDKYYPDIGIAFRFVGLTAKGQGRQSDWEVI